jgi:hypothetical protein
VSPERVLQGFGEVGFLVVKEMAAGIEIYRRAVAGFLSEGNRAIPAISSDCPAVVQLVQVKFPSLLENLVPMVPPYEIAAERLKGSLPADSPARLYYIVPCPAKAHAAANPLSARGAYSGAIPVGDLYNSLKARLHAGKGEGGAPEALPRSSRNLEWSMSGGESRALGLGPTLVVDGIRHVAGILELAENGLMEGVPFIEAWSCPGGCLGGPLNVQNPFWARFHVVSLIANHPPAANPGAREPDSGEANRYRLPRPFQARGGMRLDPDLKKAMEKLRRIDEVLNKFPGIDCGSCGCPNCLALAEDVVQGYASEKECKFLPRGTRRTPKKERKGFRDGNDERNE